MLSTELKKRFLAKIKKSSECWGWIGNRNSKGYGQIKLDGVQTLAHRVSWQLFKGNIPEKMCVCHKCDNPSCVNPVHLFLGTTKDNMQDMIQKGRSNYCGGAHTYGEKNVSAKITSNDVLIIRELATHFTQSKIAKKFRISQMQISRIVRGKHWQHVLP